MATGKQNKIYSNLNWRPLKVRDAFQFVRGNVAPFSIVGGEATTATVVGPNTNPGASPDVPFVIGVYSAFDEAAQPGNIRVIDSELLFNYPGSTAIEVNPTGVDGQPTSANQNTASSSIAAVRGCVTVGGTYTSPAVTSSFPSKTTTTTITAGYLYGVQGKLVFQGTLNTTNGEYQAGVLAQLDTSAATATYTAGTITALWVDAGASSHLTSGQFDMIDVTNSTGVNARGVLNFFGSASDLFILNTSNAASGSFLRPTTTVSTQVGSMAISYWNGSAMVTGYIPIYSS